MISRAGKLGLGSAVREGFAASTRDYLGVMDADLSHDPSILPALIDSLETHDIALGSRFKKGSTVEQWKWWRKIISEVGVKLTRVLTGVKDPLSGYFFLRRRVIEGVPLRTTGYKILLEILVKGKYESVVEIPFRFRIRKFSTSKLNMAEHLLFLKQLVAYSVYSLIHWSKKNLPLLGILGLAAFLLIFRVGYRTFWMDETMVLEYFPQSLREFLVGYWHRRTIIHRSIIFLFYS